MEAGGTIAPSLARPLVGSDAEPLFLLALDARYGGHLPAFLDADAVPAAAVLRREFPAIRDEVLGLLAQDPTAWRVNFTPDDAYRDEGWTTLNLLTDGLRYHRNRRRLPVTAALLDRLPGLCSAQVSVLAPGSRVDPHHGDTNATHRLHLGLEVPVGLPLVGLRVDGQERGWAEGEVLVFEDAHLHTVWNDSDQRRVVLIVDVVKDELRDRAWWVRAQLGAGIVLQALVLAVPAVGRLPRPVRVAVLRAGAVGVAALLPVQRRLGGRWSR